MKLVCSTVLILLFSICSYAVNNRVSSVIVGSILDVSKPPSPKKAPYPDCYYTMEVKVEKIIKGEPVAKKIVIIVPAFYKRARTRFWIFKKQSILGMKIIPFSSLSEEEQSIQQADDLGLFDLDTYFLVDTMPVPEETKLSIIPFSKGTHYISKFLQPYNKTLPREIVNKRRQRIINDLSVINSKLNKIRGEEKVIEQKFALEWQELYQKKHYADQHKFFRRGKGFFYLSPNFRLSLHQDNLWEKLSLKEVVSFNKLLLFHNIQLIILLIPDMNDIAARTALPKYRNIVDVKSAYIAKTLLENNIEAIYLDDDILANAKNYEFMYFYLIKNQHPFGVTDIATNIAINRIKERFGEQLFCKTTGELSIRKEKTYFKERYKYPKFKMNGPSYRFSEVVKTKTVFFNGKALLKHFNKQSPIMVIGNSFTITPMYRGGFPAFMSYKTGHIPDYYYTSGKGVFISLFQRILLKADTILKGKKVCIMPIGVNYFYNKALNVEHLDSKLKLLSSSSD